MFQAETSTLLLIWKIFFFLFEPLKITFKKVRQVDIQSGAAVWEWFSFVQQAFTTDNFIFAAIPCRTLPETESPPLVRDDMSNRPATGLFIRPLIHGLNFNALFCEPFLKGILACLRVTCLEPGPSKPVQPAASNHHHHHHYHHCSFCAVGVWNPSPGVFKGNILIPWSASDGGAFWYYAQVTPLSRDFALTAHKTSFGK